MRCGKPSGVNLILIGLHRVGIVGLGKAFKQIDDSGLTDREEITDRIIGLLADGNYIPDTQREAYRIALWREFLRYQGQDISEYYSEVEVKVRGEVGDLRDQFVDTLISVFGEFELRPTITFVSPTGEDPRPELLMDDDTIVRGPVSRQNLKAAVGRRISDW